MGQSKILGLQMTPRLLSGLSLATWFVRLISQFCCHTFLTFYVADNTEIAAKWHLQELMLFNKYTLVQTSDTILELHWGVALRHFFVGVTFQLKLCNAHLQLACKASKELLLNCLSNCQKWHFSDLFNMHLHIPFFTQEMANEQFAQENICGTDISVVWVQ